ncbi:hypothetical protein Q9R19_00755 [Microbacterium sp. ARD32]|uniref:hypothetical protein n=1 Tax=Microbacterium sp. ARD32 TaxID=2962577 RepID=UPI002881A08E|nr:hypothetical protein [Microbacterium sp. ARD32]MDT0156150.1 hypothetical protein [Microbacterium sp. ARD32]
MSDDFMLHQVSPDDWMIIDTRFGATDAHHLVACITEDDGRAEVRWFRHVSLPMRFGSRIEALQALITAESPTPALA